MEIRFGSMCTVDSYRSELNSDECARQRHHKQKPEQSHNKICGAPRPTTRRPDVLSGVLMPPERNQTRKRDRSNSLKCANDELESSTKTRSRPPGSRNPDSDPCTRADPVQEDLICPLSYDLFEDPVVAEDGKTYSRQMILDWFAKQQRQGRQPTSPLTRAVIGEQLVNSPDKAQAVQRFRANPACSMDLRTMLAGRASVHDLREVFSTLDELRDILVESLEGWQPPQIVMIGGESSGKSSVLERLAMMPLFPRDNTLCTRLPIHVRLRFAEECESAQLEVYNTRTNKTEEGPYMIPTDTGAIDVRDKMEEILEKEKAQISTERIIVVSIRSPYVPSIDLVDMPGVVSHPPETGRLTRQVVNDHIKMHGAYSMFLATVPAASQPNTSIAVDMIEQHKLHNKTIGVFTMSDEVGKGRPWTNFMQRLQGSASDRSGGAALDPHGWVAVVNSPVKHGSSNLAKLTKQAEEELDFVNDHLQQEHERGRAGCAALVSKLSSLFTEFLSRDWGPRTLEKLDNELSAARLEEAKLGLPAFLVMDEEKVGEIRTLAVRDARRKITENSKAMMEAFCKTMSRHKQDLLRAAQLSEVVPMSEASRLLQQRRLELSAAVKTAATAFTVHWLVVIGTCLRRSESEGKSAHELRERPCFELARFPKLVSAIAHQMWAVLTARKKAMEEAVEAELEEAFGVKRRSPMLAVKCDLSASPPTVTMKLEGRALVEWLIFAFIHHASVALEQLPDQLEQLVVKRGVAEAEACAGNRRALRAKMEKLSSAKQKLQEMLKVDETSWAGGA